MTTLLVDGANIAAQHFVSNTAIDGDGTPIGVVKGVLTTIVYAAQLIKATKIILFFDGKDGSLARRQFKKDYKSGRRPLATAGRHYVFSSMEKLEQNKQYQHQKLNELLDLLPINTITTNGFEADDAIGYCVKYKDYFNLGDIFILSSDKDFFQLLAPDVKIYSPSQKNIIDEEYVRGKFGVASKHWAIFRAISGDPSDNFKGVGGVGPAKFDEIFGATDIELTPEILTEKFSAHKSYNKIFTNKKLVEENYMLIDLKNPMISLNSKSILDKQINDFKPHYKKFEFIRGLIDLNIGTSYSTFDYFLKLL